MLNKFTNFARKKQFSEENNRNSSTSDQN